MLVDGRGVPLPLIVTGANVNDGKRLDEVLGAIMVKRKKPARRRSKHLCADAGYRSADNRRTIEAHGYIPHVVDRRKEAQIRQHDPPGAGWSRSVIARSIASASFSCAMRNSNAASSP